MNPKTYVVLTLLAIWPMVSIAQDSEEQSWSEFLQTRVTYEPNANGDTVGRFVDKLQSDFKRLNVVVEEKAREYPLPSLNFKDIPIRGALMLIQSVSNNQVAVQIDSMDEGSEYNMIFIRLNHEIQEPAITRVLTVAELIKAMDKESFLSAFEEGFQFMGEGASVPEMRFHEKTGLLFVKGSHEQVAFAQEIVQQLTIGAGLPVQMQGGLGSAGMGGMDAGPGRDGGRGNMSLRSRWLGASGSLGPADSGSGGGAGLLGSDTQPDPASKGK